MDIRNLTAEQKALILKMGKNGFDVEEMKELNKLGLYNKSVAEALYSELAGEAEEVGDKSSFFKEFAYGAVEQFNSKQHFWQKEYWMGKASQFADAGRELRNGNIKEGIYKSNVAAGIINPDVEQAGFNFKNLLTPMAILASSVLSSCVDLDDLPDTFTVDADVSQDYDIDVNVYIENDLDTLLQGLSGLNELKAILLQVLEQLKQIKEGQEKNQDAIDNINQKLNDIDVRLNALQTLFEDLKTQYGDKLDQIVKVLQDQNTSIADIVALLKQNEVDNATIIEALKQNNVDNKAILEALGQLLENDSEASKKLDEIIKLMNKGLVLNKETQDAVYKVIAMLGDIQLGNGGGEVTVDLTKVEKMLEAILDAVTKLPNNNPDNENLNKAIQNLTDLVEKFMKQEFDMGEKTQKLIETFMANFANFVEKDSANNEKLYELVSRISVTVQEFIENEAKMDKEDQELARKILNAINNLTLGGSGGDVTVEVDLSKLEALLAILVEQTGDTGQKVNDINAKLSEILDAILKGNDATNAGFDELRKLIMENNQIALGTQDMVAKLGDKLNSLGENIVATINKLAEGLDVDLEEIKAMLAAIKNYTDENGKHLLEIKDQLNLIGQSINVLLEDIPNMHEATKALLVEILNKIPDGCNCQPADMSEILAKLEIIITTIQKNPESGNEGIVDDLDDLLQ